MLGGIIERDLPGQHWPQRFRVLRRANRFAPIKVKSRQIIGVGLGMTIPRAAEQRMVSGVARPAQSFTMGMTRPSSAGFQARWSGRAMTSASFQAIEPIVAAKRKSRRKNIPIFIRQVFAS